MNTNQEIILAPRENHSIMQSAGGVDELMQQIQLVQSVMEKAMKDGEHYGKIPGCGDKPTLLKAGAEKLSFVFRLAPEFVVTEREMPNGHRECQVICTLKQINTGKFLGQGLGSCSTMESKYRFRTGPKTFTGRPVPSSYWNIRQSQPGKAQEMIGGKGFTVGKNDSGQWEICQQGEKVEHDNPADYFNTVLKMAKKRAHVDAILTATAASDIFTQDVEDIVENRGEHHETKAAKETTASNGQSATDAQSSHDWREVQLHFGKNKDKKLGDLDENTLRWFCESWIPKPFPEGSKTIKASDMLLRQSLDNAAVEFGYKQPGQ